ncbi:hypothetical protein [Sphingomonas sp. LR55]|uniref:hypothetical protein n=1 Tax=Sphingomonas sp. LR55 TaxID=3050231 RepID=UPI002FE34E76
MSYGREAIEAYLGSRRWPLAVETVLADHREPNGVSVLAARDALAGSEAVLAMCDHLVSPELYARMAKAGAGGGLRLGIDRRLGHDWVDPEDVTCVATEGDRIVAIGKGLEPHDCYDTGVFAIGPALSDALATLASPSSPKASACWPRKASPGSSIATTSTGSTSTTPPRSPRPKRGWRPRRTPSPPDPAEFAFENSLFAITPLFLVPSRTRGPRSNKHRPILSWGPASAGERLGGALCHGPTAPSPTPPRRRPGPSWGTAITTHSPPLPQPFQLSPGLRRGGRQ